MMLPNFQVGDTIYIEEHVDKQSLEKKQKQMADVKQRKFTFYGELLNLSLSIFPWVIALF